MAKSKAADKAAPEEGTEKKSTSKKKFKFNPNSRVSEHDQHHAHIQQQELIEERKRLDALEAEEEEEG